MKMTKFKVGDVVLLDRSGFAGDVELDWEEPAIIEEIDETADIAYVTDKDGDEYEVTLSGLEAYS